MDEPAYLEWYREGGVSTLAPSIGSTESARIMLNRMAAWHRLLNLRDDLHLVRRASDVLLAKEQDKLGIYFHIQGTDPIEDNLDLIDVYKALGVGTIQLTYNVKNRVGDGCEERTDAGLSKFGVRLVERLNATRIIVDCSHTGFRTSLEAIEYSQAPVILSHSNLKSVHASARNVSSELVDAIAQSGGVIGVVGFPAMVSNSTRPKMDNIFAHIDAVVQRVGIDHVGLGLDYYHGQAGVATDEVALESFNEFVRAGLWGDAYPPPPHYYPKGIETPKSLPNLTDYLLAQGYSETDVAKILGQNWLRVMQEVWG
jgi:membrane dipeptidase